MLRRLFEILKLRQPRQLISQKTKLKSRFSSVEEAATYIGKKVVHNPVEMPNRVGTLLAVEANGILVVGDWTYRCWYWQCQPV